MSRRIETLILGGGPAGLGAAWRLNELGAKDWLLLEAAPEPGGLASSVLDEKGYTWDLGGHIQFSHYDYFDRVMDELLAPEEWLRHERESWVWIRGGFVPYPFQYNIRRLPPAERWECVRGLLRLRESAPAENGPPANFREWCLRSFGEGILRVFMEPYNFKVWAHPLEELAHHWVGDRVAVTDLERALRNILMELDDVSWGPNSVFRFPRSGGTGEIWRRCAARLPAERIRTSSRAVRIDPAARRLWVEGESEPLEYGMLISTAPLDRLVALCGLDSDGGFRDRAGLLRRSSTHIVGLGLEGKPPEALRTKCWMYFPEDDCPFYRVTVFSNYSPRNVPDISRGWSLMAEISESEHKPVDAARVVESTIEGALATGLAPARNRIVHAWSRRLEYGYPTPSLRRDEALDWLLPRFEEMGILSRGRFGAWKYEVSNQDHSLMQGVEAVNRILLGEAELTLPHPEIANRPRPAKG